MKKQSTQHRHGDDGDDEKKDTPPSTPGPEAGDYDLGDDGTRIGEHHGKEGEER